jgi:hypothetical protein
MKNRQRLFNHRLLGHLQVSNLREFRFRFRVTYTVPRRRWGACQIGENRKILIGADQIGRIVKNLFHLLKTICKNTSPGIRPAFQGSDNEEKPGHGWQGFSDGFGGIFFLLIHPVNFQVAFIHFNNI